MYSVYFSHSFTIALFAWRIGKADLIIKKFTSDFYNDLEIVSKTYFGGAAHNLDRVYIYGAIPSVKVASDDNLDGEPQVLNKMISYKKLSDTWVQK